MSTTQEDAAKARIDPSGTVKTSVSIYYSLLGAGLLLFECLRHRFRHAYDSRGMEDNLFWTATVPRRSGRPFAWIYDVYKLPEEEIMERCGLDTLSFLRFLRMGQKAALLVIVLSAVLLPLYVTATPPSNTRAHTDPLESVSMSNLADRDPRLWASTGAAFIVSFFMMYLLVKEYQYYVAQRHELLGRAEAPQYSILVDELPVKLRTRATLEAYMRRIFPDTIRSVYVAVECSKLEDYVAEREEVRNALEHALAVCERSGERPEHREGRSWCGVLMCKAGSRGHVVDSIDFFQGRLAKMNEKVAREINNIKGTQAQLAKRVGEQESWEAAPYVPNHDESEVSIRIQSQRSSGVCKMTGSMVDDNADDNDDMHGREENQLEREAARKRHPIHVMRRAAFISFTSLKSAQVAQQTLQSSDPICMSISPAPHVDDIHWKNIGLRYRTRSVWKLVSSMLTAVIVLFWTIPTAFVASLATVESLRRTWPFLNRAFDNYPILEELFKQLAPLALVAFNALAPLVFSFLSGREGHPSNTEVRASVFTKLAYFQLIQIFFVTVIVGTVLDSLEEIVDRPKVLVGMLGRSMPQQSTFFISYVIVRTGLSLVLELLRVVPLLLSVLFYLFAPKLTRREREAKWSGLRPISLTDAFDPTNAFADSFLVMLVTLTFAPIAPLVCLFTGWFFFVSEIVYRRQVLFVYKSMSFALGAYWPRLYKFLIIALVVAQLTLVGILSLKKAPIPSVCIAVLIFCILVFNYYMSRLFPRVAKHLPIVECVRLDELRSQQDPASTFHFLDNVYYQPAMKEKQPIRADYRMIGDEHA
ncbi:Calcium permeable stress-gated cation channel 1, partial [Globisporangium splendens]